MKIQSKYMYGGKSTYRKGGHVPQTQMQRYAKAYQEGGTPDSVMSQLEKFEERYGAKLSTRPSRDNNMVDFMTFLRNMRENYKGLDKGAFKMLNENSIKKLEAFRRKQINDDRDDGNIDLTDADVNNLVRDQLKKMIDPSSYQDILQVQSRYKNAAKQLRKNLIKQNESGSDMSVYNQFLQDPKSFNNFYYSGEGEKILDAQRKIREKLKKEEIENPNSNPLNSLSTEERFLIGNLMQEEDGSFQIGSDEKGYKNLNTQKLYDSLSRKFNINMTNELLNEVDPVYSAPQVKKDRRRPNTNVKTTLDKGEETPREKGPTISKIGPTKIKTEDDSELMATNKEVPGADESVDATTTDDSTVTENINNTREEVTQEYIPQAMRNRMEEKKDPTDNTNPGNNIVETSVNTTINNNVTSDTGMNTGDDFSGPNPYEYGTDEYFDWKKRKRAAMFAKRGALVKKINYLKGGIYGKRNFRR